MKKTITQSDFRHAFMDWDTYKDSFSWEGLNALFDYFERYEDDIEQEIELDVVAIACEYTEYDNLEEVLETYPKIKDLEDLQDNTQVIFIEGTDRIIIQDF